MNSRECARPCSKARAAPHSSQAQTAPGWHLSHKGTTRIGPAVPVESIPTGLRPQDAHSNYF
jgi:hypothetical protein